MYIYDYVEMKLEEGKSVEEIADELGEEVSLIQAISDGIDDSKYEDLLIQYVENLLAQPLEVEEESEMHICRALVEWEQENIEKGKKEGIASGKKELLKEKVRKKLAKGKSIEVIADELEEDVPAIQSIIDELKNEE